MLQTFKRGQQIVKHDSFPMKQKSQCALIRATITSTSQTTKQSPTFKLSTINNVWALRHFYCYQNHNNQLFTTFRMIQVKWYLRWYLPTAGRHHLGWLTLSPPPQPVNHFWPISGQFFKGSAKHSLDYLTMAGRLGTRPRYLDRPIIDLSELYI